MDINRANLNAMFRTYLTAWQKGLEWKPPVDLSFLFSEFPSSSASNFYAWMDMIPGFREWLGARVFNNVRSQKHEIVNRDWEDAVSMPNKDIEDDQYGIYTPIIQMMAAAWIQLKYELVINAILDNVTSFTGSALFADDHAYGDNTIDNLTTSALSATVLQTMFTNTAAWKFANDKYVRPNWTHLLVGAKLKTTAFNLVENEWALTDDTANTQARKKNPHYKKLKLVEVPDFTGDYDDYWVVVDGSMPVHAIALQIRRAPNPLMDTDPSHVARTGQVDFMADGRAAAGAAFPHMVYGGRL